jgi:hypothetical protein
MTIKLALLKSGEEVIADIKEIVAEDQKVISFLFSNPYVVKLITPQVLMEENEMAPEREYKVSFYPWMPLSFDKDIPVNTDWVVSIVEPVEMVKKSYEERTNGRRNNSTDGRTSGGTDNTSSDLNESVIVD